MQQITTVCMVLIELSAKLPNVFCADYHYTGLFTKQEQNMKGRNLEKYLATVVG